MWSTIGLVKAYWVSVSMFILITTKADRVRYFLLGGAGASVEDKIKKGTLAILRANLALDFLQKLWPQFHVSCL